MKDTNTKDHRTKIEGDSKSNEEDYVTKSCVKDNEVDIANRSDIEVIKGVDLDTILVEEIGQFGWYQLKTILLAVVVVIFAGWQAEYVFTAARIETRCLIPECENPETTTFNASWISNAIPPTATGSFDNCRRFNTSTTIEDDFDFDNATCPAEMFNLYVRVACEEYVYENTDTVVYDFGLACDEWSRSLIGTVRTIGTLPALPLTGFISDRWGRRTALAFNAFNNGWIGVTRYWAKTYIGFSASEFFEALLGGGVYSCVYILVMELVGPKYRVLCGAIMSSSFAVGQALLGVIAWGFPNWKQMTLVIYVPQLFTICYFWVISKSVRWYMSKGRYEKSEEVLKEVARVNKKHLSDKSLLLLRLNAEEEKRKNELAKIQKSNEPSLIVQVFREKKILIRCMVSPVWWITTTFIYYGLTINSVNISGNPYVNYITVTLVEIPGFWISYFLMSRIGRKPVLTGAFWICALCQMAYLFLPEGYYAVSLTIYLVGKCSIATVVTAIYVYTAELYPTKYRHSLFAFSSMIGRVGSITAPLTPAFGDKLPFILFGGAALLAGGLVFLAPETLGTSLPDTMDQAAVLGQRKQMTESKD